MTTWQECVSAILLGIKAPISPTNLATLRAWSTREKGTWPSIQWCNILNTTHPWPGAVDSGAQPGPHDVKIYASLVDGAAATVATLLEPVAGVLPRGYDGIVAAIRQSLPTLWWEGSARTQLDTWGTGQSWLNSVPLTGDVMAKIDDIYSAIVTGKTVGGSSTVLLGIAHKSDLAALTTAVNSLKTAIAAIPAGGGGGLTDAQAAELSEALAILRRIETGLKGA
jgi:hypothetical protein